MDDREFLIRLHETFDTEEFPGNENIIHCSHDKRWGGTLDGPCRECSEVVEYFKGKGQYQHNPVQLSWVAFGLSPFTTEAFVYWLPSFIEAVMLHPNEADGAAESLEFRFESLDSEEWQNSHIGKLSQKQLGVLKEFFLIQRERRELDEEAFTNIMATLGKYASKSS